MANSFAQLPDAALTDLVGFLRDGSPLRKELVSGLGAGLGSREIGRRIRSSLGGDLTRSLRISRTEVLRAYRESTRRSF